ncbi:MAG TPA: MFS transporter [Candidatus Acidoferrales bacterium]|nr:MFS transporter [Candidatus Acidoferrales bacterium]
MSAGRMELRRKLFWISVLYFAEGFPFGLVVDNLPVYFRTHGVSLTAIGLMSLLSAPWTLKVLWSPLVDRFGTRQRWITSCLVTIALVLGVLPFFDASRPSIWLWAALMLLTAASATQDIAIDAYTIGLLDSGEEGVANGVRVSAYRAALIVGGGGLVMLADPLGWTTVFYAAAVIALGLAVAVGRSPALPMVTSDTPQAWFGPLWDWLARPGAPLIFLFVLTYKLGDSSMGPMVKPFWVDRGLSLEQIGFISTTLGVGASIGGALLGGVFTTRWGIFRGLWALGLLQAVSNLGYAAVAYFDLGHGGIYAASLCESFTGGLGTAAFLAFLMHVCDKRRAATEYALLSAIFGLTRSLAGAFSGWGTVHLGYAAYFFVTFLLALPAFALLPWVKPWAEAPTVQLGSEPISA